MSVYLWTPVSGMSQIAFSGYQEIRDIDLPVISKDEWGMDVLTRRMHGPGYLATSFDAALAQGQVHNTYFYLQSWAQVGHPYKAIFDLTYKGLRGGDLPNPMETDERVELISTTSADSLSVTYHGKTIVAATKEVKYVASQTTYRYIATSRPTSPTYGDVSNDVQIVSSYITVTFDDGTTQRLAGTAPAGVSTALSATAEPFVIGPSSVPIIGTDYWECIDQVRRQYPGT